MPGHLLARKTREAARIACLVALQLVPALAWVGPEHRDIAVFAVQRLDPEQQVLLQQLWSDARSGHEVRLCEHVAQLVQGTNPTCIDYATWTAIAGDHSCSASDMLNEILNTRWILGVVRVDARLKTQLAAAGRRDQRVNAVRDSDIALQRTDPEYVTRAQSNNAHFLLARPKVDMEPLDYARLALGPNADLNAVATYVWYHLRALAVAEHIARGGDAPEIRTQAVLVALADEAFALHFLEDSFAAGHVTGNWGTTAVRKGTHDYYSEHGVPMVTWAGHSFVGLGDAYMRPEDADRAAAAVHDSLAQLLDAFTGKVAVAASDDPSPILPEAFDICHQARFPAASGTGDAIRTTGPIIVQTPVPALSEGFGELPRFRAELGPFIGLSTAIRAGVLIGAFGPTQTDPNRIGGIEAAVRLGIGLEGVLNESSDGLTFAEFGIRDDAHATGVSTVPGRGAITARLRLPFWLIPGDLVLAAPVLAFTSKTSLQKMAVQAANGGLIPWQAGIATRIGRFQFVLGREVGVSLYRNGRGHPILVPTPGVPPANATLVAVNSIEVEFPILEYR